LLLSWFDDMMYSTLAVSTLSALELIYGGLTTGWIDIEKYHTLVSFDCLRKMHDLTHFLISKGDREIAYFHGKDILLSRNRLGSKYPWLCGCP
jgi:hypothetical protein